MDHEEAKMAYHKAQSPATESEALLPTLDCEILATDEDDDEKGKSRTHHERAASSVFDNIKQVMDVSLFPSVHQWAPTDDDAAVQEDDEQDGNDANPSLAVACTHRTRRDDDDDDHRGDELDDEGEDPHRPRKRPRHALRRVAHRFHDLTVLDTVSEQLFDKCAVVPEKYKVHSEYAQPITLTLLFRVFQSNTTLFAYQWCAVFTIAHTLYSMVTDFTNRNGVSADTNKNAWIMLDFLSHQVVDSFSVHALITTMLLHPGMFGSNAYNLAIVLILTQPIHLSVWFKSNFGSGGSTSQTNHSSRWVILNTMVAFAVPSMLLLVVSPLNHHRRGRHQQEDMDSGWQTLKSVFFFLGIVGFNLAPIYTLMHAYKHEQNARKKF